MSQIIIFCHIFADLQRTPNDRHRSKECSVKTKTCEGIVLDVRVYLYGPVKTMGWIPLYPELVTGEVRYPGPENQGT
jgi:hypothetical protein